MIVNLIINIFYGLVSFIFSLLPVGALTVDQTGAFHTLFTWLSFVNNLIALSPLLTLATTILGIEFILLPFEGAIFLYHLIRG